MHRRNFIKSSLAASVTAVGGSAQSSGGARQYYELRQYKLVDGPQTKITAQYLEEALIPALNRLGMKDIGAFDLYIGPATPSVYLLIPSDSLDALVSAELKLANDEEYQKAGRAFLKAPATEPPYSRIESQLLIAFEGHPRLTLPPATAKHAARVFQLRTYESPTNSDHRTKVDMFNNGEFNIFEKAGFWQVFYGDSLVGPRLPHLTYMLSFPDLSEMQKLWSAFINNPDWKKLSTSPTYSFEHIVSNIDSLILNPTSYSQI